MRRLQLQQALTLGAVEHERGPDRTLYTRDDPFTPPQTPEESMRWFELYGNTSPAKLLTQTHRQGALEGISTDLLATPGSVLIDGIIGKVAEKAAEKYGPAAGVAVPYIALILSLAAPRVARSPALRKVFLGLRKTGPSVSNSPNVSLPRVEPSGGGRVPLPLVEAPAEAGNPLLIEHRPTTRTLSQVRRLQQPAKWEAGEQYVQELYGSRGQAHFPVPEGGEITGSGGRFVDAPVDLPNGGVLANEVKTYGQWRTVKGVPEQKTVPLTEKIRQQILKDVWLRDNIPNYDPRWIFLDASPSSELAEFLSQHRIVTVNYR